MQTNQLHTKMRLLLINKINELKSHGCTQDDVASLLGTTRVYINRVINNKNKLTIDTIEKYLETLGVNYDISIKVNKNDK